MAKNRIQNAVCFLAVLLAALVAAPASLSAADAHDHFTPGKVFCSSLLDMHARDEASKTQVGTWSLITSGRDKDLIPKYVEAIQKIFGAGGVAQQLGYALPPHLMTMAPSSKLAILATLGRYPIPHWLDGMRIAREAAGAMGVMEFVTPGCPTCRSFYRDTTSFIEQLSILFHVAGHNDFSVHSPFAFRRQADPMKASMELADMLLDYSEKYDKDAVHLFYQYLNSFSFMQDLNNGEFTHPDDFKTGGTADADLKKVDHSAESPYLQENEPNVSGIQALVAYLKANGPEWKYNLAAKYEEMVRVYGYVPVTKIMNEGWATLSMILMVAHSEYGTSHHILEYANLMSGVAYPRLTNPYWLGLEAWLRVYKRFDEEHPEYKNLTLLERDRKFVEHAHQMMAWMNDQDFLRNALDEQWVYENQLMLYRRAQQDEQDPNMPWDPNHPEDNEQKIVVSDNASTVINYVADLAANKRKQLPRILVKSMHGLDRNVFYLVHDVYDNIPLEMNSAAQALYLWGQLSGAPVALDTIRAKVLQEALPRHGEKIVTVPIRIEIDLGGRVSVRDLEPDQANPELTQQMQTAVDNYKESITGLVNGDLEADWKDLKTDRGRMLMKIADQNSDHVIEGILHDPNAAAAVREYLGKLKSILPSRMNAQIRNGNLRRTKTGLAVPIFPKVPEFQFDTEILEKMESLAPPMPVERLEKGLALPSATYSIDVSRFSGDKASLQALVHQIASISQPGKRVNLEILNWDKASRGTQELTWVLTSQRHSRVDGTALDLSQATVWFTNGAGARELRLEPKAPDYKLHLGSFKTDSALTQQRGGFRGVRPGRGARRRGERFWGPGEGGGGEGQPGPGEPGKDALEPQEVEITLEDYGKYLAEQMELPNIRRTSGDSQRTRLVPEGSMLKPEGEIDWMKTVARPNAYGFALLNRQLRELQVQREEAAKSGDAKRVEDLDQKIMLVRRKITSIVERIKTGLKVTTESDYYTEVKTPETIPDFKAVVFFMIDMSGSMGGEPQATAKNISYKIRAILRHFYKSVDVVFVGFDTKGHEFPEDKVFGSFLGGGTEYASGYEKVQELYARYPRAQYNRYLITLGDGETGADDAQRSTRILDELYPQTQYIGFGYLNMNSWAGASQFSGPFTQGLQAWGADKEWFGFADIRDSSEQSQIDAIRKFFGKKKTL